MEQASIISDKKADFVSVSWGFAEATFFFLVPDVWITLIALSGMRKGLRACMLALAGALVGGLTVYLLGVYYRPEIFSFYDWIPAISPEMLQRVLEDVQNDGVFAVLMGPASGTPYKIYAAAAADANLGLLAFFAISIPARLFRFVAACLAARLLAVILKKKAFNTRVLVMATLWIVGYSLYFIFMPN